MYGEAVRDKCWSVAALVARIAAILAGMALEKALEEDGDVDGGGVDAFRICARGRECVCEVEALIVGDNGRGGKLEVASLSDLDLVVLIPHHHHLSSVSAPPRPKPHPN